MNNSVGPFCRIQNPRRTGKMAPPYLDNLSWKAHAQSPDSVEIQVCWNPNFVAFHRSHAFSGRPDSIPLASAVKVPLEDLLSQG